MSANDHTHASDDAALAALDRVTVRYGSTVAAAEVTLEVCCGQVYALLGRNGAGKSTLVRYLLGQQQPTEGHALLFGADAWTTRRRAMARVGVVPEGPDLPRSLHADDLAAFGARLYPRWDSAGVAARLAMALVFAAAFAGGTAVANGATMVATDLKERRLGFYFARPLSGTAIWAGKLIAGLLLALGSGLLALLPASRWRGASSPGGSRRAPFPSWSAAPCCCSASPTWWRSRSPLAPA